MIAQPNLNSTEHCLAVLRNALLDVDAKIRMYRESQDEAVKAGKFGDALQYQGMCLGLSSAESCLRDQIRELNNLRAYFERMESVK